MKIKNLEEFKKNKISGTILKFCIQYLNSSFSVQYIEKDSLVIVKKDLNGWGDIPLLIGNLNKDYDEMINQYKAHLRKGNFSFHPVTKVVECKYYFK